MAALAVVVGLDACGGGGGDASAPPPATDPDNAQRARAAAITAASATNPCAAIEPFYWEIGDANSSLASASVDSAASTPTYDGSTVISIASASKWLYAAYVVERKAGVLDADDIRYLTFRSGYTRFTTCLPAQTIDECVAYSTYGDYVAADDGTFFYGGGHMEKHASLLGLGALDAAGLAGEVRTQLGADVALTYSQAQPAGGVVSNADSYARFLRKVLGGQLRIGALLGSNPVCTNPSTCVAAGASPAPANESWHYSIGHWVEDDPVVGDGAFSSAGAFGFYPWIDAGRRYYGIVARQVAPDREGVASVYCGRLIRKAWATGVAQ